MQKNLANITIKMKKILRDGKKGDRHEEEKEIVIRIEKNKNKIYFFISLTIIYKKKLHI